MGTQEESPNKLVASVKESLAGVLSGVSLPFFPNFCGACECTLRNPAEQVCEDCLSAFPSSNPNYCRRCGASQGPYVGAIDSCSECKDFGKDWSFTEVAALGEHKGCLRDLVVNLKFRGRHRNARLLAESMATIIAEREWPIDALVPLPLGKQRHFERGYDQAALLAKELAKLLERPLLATALKRAKETKAQTTLNAQERRANMRSAFAIKIEKELLKDKNLLLVDDVLTTGATLSAAAKALRKAKPAAIYAIVASRASH